MQRSNFIVSNKNCKDQHRKRQQQNSLVVRLDFWSSAFLIQNDKAADTVFWLLLFVMRTLVDSILTVHNLNHRRTVGNREPFQIYITNYSLCGYLFKSKSKRHLQHPSIAG